MDLVDLMLLLTALFIKKGCDRGEGGGGEHGRELVPPSLGLITLCFGGICVWIGK